MRKTLLLGIALMMGACGRTDPIAPDPPEISGSYELTMVDGHELPYTFLDLGAYQQQLVSGSLTLDATGTYALEFDRRVLDSGRTRAEADLDAGLWNQVGDAITLASTQGGISRTGTVSGGSIALQGSVLVFVPRR